MTTKNLAERIGVVETRVENLNEKLDELKSDVVSSKEEIKEHLDCIAKSAEEAHAVLTEKITNLERVKDKWFWIFTGALAVIAWKLGDSGLIIQLLEKIL